MQRIIADEEFAGVRAAVPACSNHRLPLLCVLKWVTATRPLLRSIRKRRPRHERILLGFRPSGLGHLCARGFHGRLVAVDRSRLATEGHPHRGACPGSIRRLAPRDRLDHLGVLPRRPVKRAQRAYQAPVPGRTPAMCIGIAGFYPTEG